MFMTWIRNQILRRKFKVTEPSLLDYRATEGYYEPESTSELFPPGTHLTMIVGGTTTEFVVGDLEPMQYVYFEEVDDE